MSHAAMLYVKHLRFGVGGEALTASEKSVLHIVADDHREELGCAFRGVPEIARQACVSVRHCRRLLASLEGKGILLRNRATRDRDGGDTTNEYTFPAIDARTPLDPAVSGQARLKILHTPRTRVSSPPGRGCPPTEHLEDLLQDPSGGENTPPLPLLAGGDVEPPSQATAAKGWRIEAGELRIPETPASSDPRDLAESGLESGLDAVDAVDAPLGPAVAEVMRRCSFSRRRIGGVIAKALAARLAQTTSDASIVAAAMARSWLEFQALGPMRRHSWGPEKFFGDGHWLNTAGWPIDNHALHRHSEASLGVWRE